MIKPFIMNGGEICRLLKGRKYNVLNNSAFTEATQNCVFFWTKFQFCENIQFSEPFSLPVLTFKSLVVLNCVYAVWQEMLLYNNECSRCNVYYEAEDCVLCFSGLGFLPCILGTFFVTFSVCCVHCTSDARENKVIILDNNKINNKYYAKR